jgi:hypothetical protein
MVNKDGKGEERLEHTQLGRTSDRGRSRMTDEVGADEQLKSGGRVVSGRTWLR